MSLKRSCANGISILDSPSAIRAAMQLPVAVGNRIQQTRFLSGSRVPALKYLNIPEHSSTHGGRIKFPMCGGGPSIQFLPRKNPRSIPSSCSHSDGNVILKLLRPSQAVSINQESSNSNRRACHSNKSWNRVVEAGSR